MGGGTCTNGVGGAGGEVLEALEQLQLWLLRSTSTCAPSSPFAPEWLAATDGGSCVHKVLLPRKVVRWRPLVAASVPRSPSEARL